MRYRTHESRRGGWGTLTVSVGLALGSLTGCGSIGVPTQGPPQTVDYVDLSRYVGRWYEIASYPVWFETNCTAVTADYAPRDDGTIEVVNTCRKLNPDGQVQQIVGTARVADTTSNARLKVTFFGPLAGDYWIIDLDPDYRYAVVSDPARQTLFILSRTPELDAATYDGILARLAEQGFDINRLHRTPQATTAETGS